MKFIDSPTEQTTAVTDAIMGGIALVLMLYIRSIGMTQPWKATLWGWAFALLTSAGILGAIAHGFKFSKVAQTWLWRPLFLILGLLVSLFVVAAIHDAWGTSASSQALPIMMVVGVLFFGTTLIWPDTFLGFIIYEGIAMFFVLGCYIWLAWQGDLSGAWWMVAGILVTMIAAGIQASQAVSFTLIWPFDHNGVYHLVQIVALFLLAWGLRLAFFVGVT